MATLYYWKGMTGHVALLIEPSSGSAIYVSHRPNLSDIRNTPRRGTRHSLPGFNFPHPVRRFPRYAVPELADEEEPPTATLALSGLVIDDAMVVQARLFLNASATTDPFEYGYHPDYSYYQLVEDHDPPYQQPWQAQRRQCVTTTNRLLHHGISSSRQDLKDAVGTAPRSPRNQGQPWTTAEVYNFCQQHLI